jgi:beta-lactamase regulating signal transducer with metallopeptidase domain
MEQIFKSVLLLSAVGTILSVALLLLKPVTKRVFGSQWQYYIWLCVLVVMMLPVSFKMPIKTNMNITVPQGQQAVQEYNNTEINTNIGQTSDVAGGKAPMEYRSIGIAKGITLNLLDVIIYTWLIGMGIFFFAGVISYLRFLRTIRKNSEVISCSELEAIKEQKEIKRKISVRTTELLTAPLMVGLFKPTLLLPNTQMSEAELYYILLHELTHLKRNDLWYKWFAMLVNAVHWFNPLSYVISGQINEECEISCDLSVTRDMNEDEKNGYMNTIISLLSANKEKSKMLTTAMASDKNQIKRRFVMIKKAKSTNRFMSVISVITAVIILTTTIFASGVLANMINAGSNVTINGKSYDIKPIHIDNERYLYTNSWYVPLRDVFEALGCTINYDVGSDKLPQGRELQSFPQYEWRENLITDSITLQIYGATTLFNDNMPIIEIISAEGNILYCQIGCEFYTPFGSSPPPIIMNGKTYISIALIDGFMQNGENSNASVSWDGQKQDTYYMGKVTWDDRTNSLIIDENVKPAFENYNKTLNYLNLDGRRIMQRIENDKYAFCLVENYTDEKYESCIAVEKFTGEIAVMGEIDKSIAHLIRINFEDDDTVLVNKLIIGESHNNALEFYQKYNLATGTDWVDEKDRMEIAKSLIISKNPIIPGQSDIERLADIWANAWMTRDGKARYEIMSESMKLEFGDEQLRVNGNDGDPWVIRWSSPWVVSYSIEVNKDKAAINYKYTDSTTATYEGTEFLTIGNENGKSVVISHNDSDIIRSNH